MVTGLLRCIGASATQIRAMVFREALLIAFKAVVPGLLLGITAATICATFLKYFASSYYGEIALFNISWIAVAAGAGTGFLTVMMSAFIPARKAARVSPVSAATGSDEFRVKKSKKKGYLARVLPVELAMASGNALARKKVLIAMSLSIGIILLLCFNVLTNFLYTGMFGGRPYAADFAVLADRGISRQEYNQLASLDGVENVYRRMTEYIPAAFDSELLTEEYREIINQVRTGTGGMFVPPEKSLLLSYDSAQLEKSEERLISGEINPDEMNSRKGFLVVTTKYMNNVPVTIAGFQPGDKIYLDTENGQEELMVTGVLESLPFGVDDNKEVPILLKLVTTEEVFSQITGKDKFQQLDINLQRGDSAAVESGIKALCSRGEDRSYRDLRQINTKKREALVTAYVFIYGFVLVVSLIGALNVVNTMNTNIVAKTRYFGMLRAVGMSHDQLKRMIMWESVIYGLFGSVTGAVVGTLLARLIYEKSPLVTYFDIPWSLPVIPLVIAVSATMMINVVSVIYPLRRIKNMKIAEVISAP